jgi:hypothetical protein
LSSGARPCTIFSPVLPRTRKHAGLIGTRPDWVCANAHDAPSDGGAQRKDCQIGNGQKPTDRDAYTSSWPLCENAMSSLELAGGGASTPPHTFFKPGRDSDLAGIRHCAQVWPEPLGKRHSWRCEHLAFPSPLVIDMDGIRMCRAKVS